jgi:hypothetical protein
MHIQRIALLFTLLAGCATDPSASMREAVCASICARVLHPMSLSQPSGSRSCTCWAPMTSYETMPRPVTASVRVVEVPEELAQAESR